MSDPSPLFKFFVTILLRHAMSACCTVKGGGLQGRVTV